MADSAGIINQARSAQDPNVMSTAADAPSTTANPATTATPQTTPPADNVATPSVTQTPAAPATTPAPAPVATPSIATTADINSAYASLFGRPADAAGADFWQKAATTYGWNADQLKQKIAAGAQKEDVTAGGALQGNGSLAQNWAQNGLTTDQIGSTIHWDPTTNQWVNKPSANAAGYAPTLLGDPTKWNITPEQTTAGQLATILDPNSPIIRQAMTQGLELANERGLLNSSIAQGAAQNAAYAAAVPIASADAATYSKAAGYNADQSNQFAVQNANYSNSASQFNASQANDMSKTQLSADTQKSIADLQSKTQTNLAYLDSQTKTNLAQLDSNTRVSLATIESNYHQLMQSNQSASDLFRQITQNITNISMSKDMDGTAKQTAVNNQLQLLQNGLGVNGAVSHLNLGDLLDFSGINNQTQTTGEDGHP